MVLLLCTACSETPLPNADAGVTNGANASSAPPELRHLPLGGGAAPADAGVDCSPIQAGATLPNHISGGPCDDRDPEHVADLTRVPLGTYAIDCDPQPLDAAGCKGIPTDIWSRCAHDQCAARHSYPEGCNLVLPSQNPNYPGPGQGCACMRSFGSDQVMWTCGL